MIENWINSGIIFINDIIDGQGNISEVVILQNLICKQNWMETYFLPHKQLKLSIFRGFRAKRGYLHFFKVLRKSSLKV
jgi:hypothetical protein